MRQIHQPLTINVVLSPEDPRLADLEQNVLRKLQRVLPRLEVHYTASTVTGLFEKPEDHYGEIWYEMNGQKVMERSTIEQVVLETIYKLSGVTTPEQTQENVFSGYPLTAHPRGAGWIFYAVWPLMVVFAWWLVRR